MMLHERRKRACMKHLFLFVLIFPLNCVADSDVVSRLFDDIAKYSSRAPMGLNSPLLPEQAFVFSSKVYKNKIVARWDIADGYYLYRDKFKFSLNAFDKVIPINIDIPRAQQKSDSSGDVYVFHNSLEVILNISLSQRAPDGMVLKTSYQGCGEVGICYPLMSREIVIVLPGD